MSESVSASGGVCSVCGCDLGVWRCSEDIENVRSEVGWKANAVLDDGTNRAAGVVAVRSTNEDVEADARDRDSTLCGATNCLVATRSDIVID